MPTPQSTESATTGDPVQRQALSSRRGRDRMGYTDDPLIDGRCDVCGGAMDVYTPRRGDKRRFCGDDCSRVWRNMCASSGRFLMQQTLIARVFKHADPARADEARSKVAQFFSELIEDMDALRAARNAADPEADRITLAEIRRLARKGSTL